MDKIKATDLQNCVENFQVLSIDFQNGVVTVDNNGIILKKDIKNVRLLSMED